MFLSQTTAPLPGATMCDCGGKHHIIAPPGYTLTSQRGPPAGLGVCRNPINNELSKYIGTRNAWVNTTRLELNSTCMKRHAKNIREDEETCN